MTDERSKKINSLPENIHYDGSFLEMAGLINIKESCFYVYKKETYITAKGRKRKVQKTTPYDIINFSLCFLLHLIYFPFWCAFKGILLLLKKTKWFSEKLSENKIEIISIGLGIISAILFEIYTGINTRSYIIEIILDLGREGVALKVLSMILADVFVFIVIGIPIALLKRKILEPEVRKKLDTTLGFASKVIMLKGTPDDRKKLSDLAYGADHVYQSKYGKTENTNVFPKEWLSYPVERRLQILFEAFQKNCEIQYTEGYNLYIEVKDLEMRYAHMVHSLNGQKDIKPLPKNWGKYKRLFLKKRVLEEAINHQISVDETEAFKIMDEEDNLKQQFLQIYNKELKKGLVYPEFWILFNSPQKRIEMLREACEKHIALDRTELYEKVFGDYLKELHKENKRKEKEAFDKNKPQIVKKLFDQYAVMMKTEQKITDKLRLTPELFDEIVEDNIKIMILAEANARHCLINETFAYRSYEIMCEAENEYMNMLASITGKVTSRAECFSEEWEKSFRFKEKSECLQEAIERKVNVNEVKTYALLCEESVLMQKYTDSLEKLKRFIVYWPDDPWKTYEYCEGRIEILKEAIEKECFIGQTKLYQKEILD